MVFYHFISVVDITPSCQCQVRFPLDFGCLLFLVFDKARYLVALEAVERPWVAIAAWMEAARRAIRHALSWPVPAIEAKSTQHSLESEQTMPGTSLLLLVLFIIS